MTLSANFLWAGMEAMGLPVPDENKWNLIRNYRGELLARCDWTQIGDAPFTAEEKTAWTNYRQTLRDLPQDFSSPNDVIFPGEPA